MMMTFLSLIQLSRIFLEPKLKKTVHKYCYKYYNCTVKLYIKSRYDVEQKGGFDYLWK